MKFYLTLSCNNVLEVKVALDEYETGLLKSTEALNLQMNLEKKWSKCFQ